jgi:hypothetical protein
VVSDLLIEVLTVMTLGATAGTQAGACADRYDIEPYRVQTLANAQAQLVPGRYELFEEAYIQAYGQAYNSPATCKEVLKAMSITPAQFEQQIKLGVDKPAE